MREQVMLPDPLPCDGCGLPSDFAEVGPEGEPLPWHDLCAARVDRLAAAVTAARDRRLASGR